MKTKNLTNMAFGHLRLDKITSRHIQQFINDLALKAAPHKER